MGADIVFVIALNIIIAIIGTLAYAVRIVGIRTGKVAISFALFNVLALVSRTANVFQLPILTKFVEQSNRTNNDLIIVFNLILVSIFAASVIGAFLIPIVHKSSLIFFNKEICIQVNNPQLYQVWYQGHQTKYKISFQR